MLKPINPNVMVSQERAVFGRLCFKGNLMSNRQWRKKNGPPARRPCSSRLVITLALICAVGVSLLAQVSLRRNGEDASSEVSLAGFVAGSPSKEYVYAGGRLIATEEPTGAPPPAVYQGSHDVGDCQIIAGWAWDANQPNSPINAEIYDGTTLIATATANIFRQDLLNAGIGNGVHGFSIATPASVKNGQPHSIRVKFSGTSTDLFNSPKTISCGGAPPAPASFQGFHDVASCQFIAGWAWDSNQPNTSINVDIYDGTTLIATVVANIFRQDLANAGYGNGNHGFSIATPASLKDAQSHLIRVKFSGTSSDLFNTPKTINCGGAPTAPASFQGFHDVAGCQIIAGWAWDSNQPNSPINLDIYDGTTVIATVTANIFRQDLLNAGIGNGVHGFSFATPASLKNGQPHSIRMKFSGTSTDLQTTPKTITCSP
jgi:hypothetical protein